MATREVRTGVRLSLISLLLAALLLVLGTRLWYLQVLASPQYARAAVVNTVRTVSIPAPRGLILDRTGKVLVGNRASWAVTVNLGEIPFDRRAAELRRLARVVHESPARIRSYLVDYNGSPYAGIPVADDVSKDTLFYLAEHSTEYPGVSSEVVPLRMYPYGTAAAQLLGYVGEITAAELKAPAYKGMQPGDIVGQSGVEYSFDKYLRGRDGVERLEVNAVGDVVKVLSVTPPVPGDNVELSLDIGLQQQLDTDLANQIRHLHNTGYPAPTGASVVLDPRDGSVLAMSSYPTYNPSVWVGGISEANYRRLSAPSGNYPLINRVIDGFFAPGSTFKVATATAALDDGLITPTSLITDPGSFTIPGCTAGQCTFHNSEGESLGPINVTTALTASDDVFFYNLGYDFWIQRHHYGDVPIQTMANRYGLGETSGIDLPGEASGRVDSQAERVKLHRLYPSAYPYTTWYAGDNVEMAFGQGGTVITPLQLANAYATFGERGVRYRPQVAAAATVQGGRIVWRAKPVVAGHVPLPASTYHAMLQGFIGATQSPSGTAGATFAGFPFSKLDVAGKTGTATGSTNQPTALFAAFAPAPDPRYAMAVVIPEAGFGAVGAAPVAREIMTWLISHPIEPVAKVSKTLP